MRGSATTIIAAVVGLAVLPSEPAWAVCPGAASGDGLLVLDLSGCDQPVGEARCGSERRGFDAACTDDAAGSPAARSLGGTGPQEQRLMLASWSPVAEAAAMEGPPADSAGIARPSGEDRAGSSLGMAASLIAGLGLAGAQMRRRRGMQVVSS